MSKKVIKIKDETFEYRQNQSYRCTCDLCDFRDDDDCPDTVCAKFNVDGEQTHYLRKIDKQHPLVEAFKEAAGIKQEKTYTRAQIIAAHADWHGSFNSDAVAFADHLEKVSDPEYQEFLRLKEKFNG